ncbi:phosphoribosyl transferase [Angustibacter sp. Root456]|nr:phosphoribosyl transferase [Angustibacter sp. Root456]
MHRFADRADAGRRLADHLAARPWPAGQVVVLGVPRGGVPVAVPVAQALGAPLDVLVVRKLGLPYQRELAMGAVGEGGVRVLNEEVLRRSGVTAAQLAAVQGDEQREVDVRCARFRPGRQALPLAGRVAVVVDDGIATGSTMRAACQIARASGAQRVVVAVPVASREAVEVVRRDADEVVVLSVPPWFSSVGQWYDDFAQVSDDTVARLLAESTTAPRPATLDPEVTVPAGDVDLAATLTVPASPVGVIAFAHGSGSSRHSPRNRYVAGRLQQAGLATLLLDLLTAQEDGRRDLVFDVPLLSERLGAACRWLAHDARTRGLPLGLFGASTGAAAAIATAADPASTVQAVVSRGGRPDLAPDHLPLVRAPTLLVVGGDDDVVLELNQRAQERLRCPSRLVVVPGATHLFEEPGTLEQVADLAAGWFTTHLHPPAAQPSHHPVDADG